MIPIRYRDFAALDIYNDYFYDSVWFMKRLNAHRWEEYILRTKEEISVDMLITAKKDGMLISIPPRKPSLAVVDYIIENLDTNTFYQLDEKLLDKTLKRLFGCRQATETQKVFLKLKYNL